MRDNHICQTKSVLFLCIINSQRGKRISIINSQWEASPAGRKTVPRLLSTCLNQEFVLPAGTSWNETFRPLRNIKKICKVIAPFYLNKI